MGLLAAWSVLLYQHSGQEDIVVGIQTAGRTHPQTESLVGYFVNMLPLRVDLSGNPQFLEIIDRVKVTCAEALANDIPLDLIIDKLMIPREPSRHPVFQTLMTYNALHLEDFTNYLNQFRSLPIHDLEEEYDNNHVTQMDVQCNFVETHAYIDGTIIYDKNLFEHSTIQRMVTHFQTLLKTFTSAAHVSILNLPEPDEDPSPNARQQRRWKRRFTT